jgi:hypothetical protein
VLRARLRRTWRVVFNPTVQETPCIHPLGTSPLPLRSYRWGAVGSSRWRTALVAAVLTGAGARVWGQVAVLTGAGVWVWGLVAVLAWVWVSGLVAAPTLAPPQAVDLPAVGRQAQAGLQGLLALQVLVLVRVLWVVGQHRLLWGQHTVPCQSSQTWTRGGASMRRWPPCKRTPR